MMFPARRPMGREAPQKEKKKTGLANDLVGFRLSCRSSLTTALDRFLTNSAGLSAHPRHGLGTNPSRGNGDAQGFGYGYGHGHGHGRERSRHAYRRECRGGYARYRA